MEKLDEGKDGRVDMWPKRGLECGAESMQKTGIGGLDGVYSGLALLKLKWNERGFHTILSLR